MLPVIYREIEGLVRRWPPPGHRLLELGATPETAARLTSRLPDLDYTGIDVRVDSEGRTSGILEADAHALPFDDNSYEAIVSNSMFEHDPAFWLSLAEVRRVLSPEGMFYVGVPGYSSKMSAPARLARKTRNRLLNLDTPLGKGLGHSWLVNAPIATTTYPVHGTGFGDYFRFSQAGVCDVLLGGYEVFESSEVLSPPRIIAAGRKMA